MPASGPVYQPTTVTYDQQPSESRWNCPMSYFSQRITSEINKTRFLLWGTFLLGLIIVAAGLKILIDGALGSSTAYLVVGILMLLVGVTLLGIFMHLVVRRTGVFGKGSVLGGEGGGGGGVGGTGSLGAQANPSTDPLVGAQYAPVRDAPPGDDERRQLMDNKDCLSSAEESDRMLDSDPRIVLRPLKNVEEA